jgi:hypothetical protein
MSETRTVPARKIKPLVWILGGIGLLLLCATLAIALLAVRAVRKAGLAFRFDPTKKTLVLIGADGNEVKTSTTGDGGHALDAAEQKVLVTWLAQHPEYRAAVDSDCACDEALRLNPGAHPYTASGDFNHDGKKDFAAAVISKKTGKFALLIFNGPIGGIQPALFLKDLDLQRQGLFFDLPFEKPNLYYGHYNSDDLWRFIWSRNKYGLEYALPGATSATLSNSAAETLLVENRHINPKLPSCSEWGQQTTGCVYVEFTYAELVGGPAEARERINAAIMALVTACWAGPEGDLCNDRHTQPSDNRKFTPESLAQYIIDGVGPFQKDHPSARSSMLSRSVTVLRNEAPVFSLECGESSYIGGVHATSATSYLNFDPVTGEPVKLSSILKDGAMARLTAIAEVHFRQARKLSETAKLDDEGFGFPGGRFALNDNYGFSEKALLFFFNHYEIAPYAMGSTLVEIPYAEIRDLIRPRFPL